MMRTLICGLAAALALTTPAAAQDRRVEMHHWPDCSHTFYSRNHRDRLLGAIES